MDSTKSMSNALSSIRSISMACLVLFVVFVVALPILRETSDEERIIPDLVTWSTLENALPMVAAQYPAMMHAKPNAALFSPNSPLPFRYKAGKDSLGNDCNQLWLKSESEIGSKLSLERQCPVALFGLFVPGKSGGPDRTGGELLLLYPAATSADSVVEELLYPYFYSFERLPYGDFISDFPTSHYAIVKLRMNAPGGGPGKYSVLPRDGAEKLLYTKANVLPPMTPYPGPFNSLEVQQVMWRAGKAQLAFGPGADPAHYFQELNEWLTARVRNPPKVSVFGIGMDPTFASSIFGIMLGLIGFSIAGPYFVLRTLRHDGMASNWTMAARTSSPGLLGMSVEAAACVLSAIFTAGPIAIILAELWYRILRPLDSTWEFLVAAANGAAALVATIAFFFVVMELRRRRRLYAAPEQ